MDAITTHLRCGIDEAEEIVRRALAEQGFGVLTEVDVAATFKAKLGLDRAPLRILGACNPQLAFRALELDRTVSLVLPCNVVLEEDATGTTVSIADPRRMMPDPAFSSLAEEAAAKLTAAAGAVSGGSVPS